MPVIPLSVLALFLLLASAADAQVITTIAGTDFHFPTGSLPALNAPLGDVLAVTVDPSGNVLTADPSNNQVFRITIGGTLNVVAGNGIPDFSGDGGPAAFASLDYPQGVAADAAGNVYILDVFNSRIRKVSNGIITTIAGNGIPTFSGDGGPATSASINVNYGGIAIDAAGNIYIADDLNQRVRKVSNGIITTVAGNGTQGFSGDGGPAINAALNGPSRVTLDGAGNLYIADSGNQRVRKVSNGIITTVAGNGNPGFGGDGGPATSAYFNYPSGLTFDAAGNLYIADTLNYRIREVSNGIITTVAGTGTLGFSGDGGPATAAELYAPYGVAVDAAGNLYIADASNRRIRKVSNGIINTFAGNGQYRFSGDGGPAISATFYSPQGLAMDAAANVYIGDGNRIRKVSNGIITTVAGNGSYGFSGDGASATSAAIQSTGVAVDAGGNLYIADIGNSRIRKVSNGTITTVAGNGKVAFSGDGGPATSASLEGPYSVALDAAGNIFMADNGNNRIREVSNGIITTVAGSGPSCSPTSCGSFSGDGGPATSATLSQPNGVTVDAAGNIYIADTYNNRIRKVTNGIVTTVAGDGIQGFSGDGGSAIGASLNKPYGVAVNASGNLYIADTGNNRIRKVSNGNMTTVAGNGRAAFAGDGGLATAASLNFPTVVTVDSAGNLYIADSTNSRIREVLASPPAFGVVVSGDSLSLTQASGGKPVTASLNVDAAIAGSSSVSVPGMSYSASVTTGNSWLSVSPASGSTPGLISVTANPLNLAPGIYNGTIVINVPLANPPMQTVNVQFTVTPGVPPTLKVDQSQLSFNYATTSAARSQTLIVSNSGGGSLNFTTSVSLQSGVSANWLSVSPQNGTATPGNPVSLAVTADPTMLSAGTYTGSVTINGGSAGTAKVQVTMTITTNPLVMLLSQAGLTFTAVENGGAIPPQTFGVLNLGSGTLNWTVQTSTLTGGNWLIATPNSGSTSSADAGGAPLVTVSVNPAGLAPGVYYGLVKVISPGASNTPQEAVAVLQVLAAGTDVAPIVQPATLIFSSPAGVSSPSSQIVSVYDPTGTNKSFRSGVVTTSGGNFLETLPTDATIAPSEPTEIVVQPLVNNLAPGTYTGTLTLQFSDGRVSTVGITFVVTGAAAASGENPQAVPRDTTGCTPMTLNPQLTTLGQNFTVPAVFPQGLTALVTDNCGNPLTDGKVTVQFSTGQGATYMQSLNNGRWDVTWQTGSVQASSVTLTVLATDSTGNLTGQAQITGAIGVPQPSPLISPGGVVSAASYTPTAVAPGGFIAIFGSLLSEGTGGAASLPLPGDLNFTTVTLGDLTLPLFYTSTGTMGQVNALVPYEVPLNTTLPLLVQRNTTYAGPVSMNIAAAQPGVLVYGNPGAQEAIAVDTNGNLIGPSNPTHAGNVLVMYCLGLGAVSPTVADGAAAPSNPPASTVNPVAVTVGGQTANVSFAGLTPTLAGLYQIDLTVPSNTGTGDQVPVVVSTGGQISVAVNLSVQ